MSSRVYFLNDKMEPRAHLWQIQRLSAKGHEALCTAVVDSFTVSPDPAHIPQTEMLTPEAAATKLIGLTVGAPPVMGAAGSGQPLAVATPGPTGNMAPAILVWQKVYSKEHVFVAWCCPHPWDLVAACLEDHSSVHPS